MKDCVLSVVLLGPHMTKKAGAALGCTPLFFYQQRLPSLWRLQQLRRFTGLCLVDFSPEVAWLQVAREDIAELKQDMALGSQGGHCRAQAGHGSVQAGRCSHSLQFGAPPSAPSHSCGSVDTSHSALICSKSSASPAALPLLHKILGSMYVSPITVLLCGGWWRFGTLVWGCVDLSSATASMPSLL